MGSTKLEQVLALWKIARHDPKSCEIGKRYEAQEDVFSEMVAGLSKEQQDIAWDFVCTSDEVNHRLLELICECFHIDPIGYLQDVTERNRKA